MFCRIAFHNAVCAITVLCFAKINYMQTLQFPQLCHAGDLVLQLKSK